MADDSVFEAIHADLEAGRARHQAERRRQGYSPYNDRRWRKRAEEYLALHPICVGCGKPAQCCDHVLPLSVRDDDPLLSPVQSLCRACHIVKQQKIESAYKRGECDESALMMDSPFAQRMLPSKLGCDTAGMPLSEDHPWRQTINARKGLK